jgi:hypothetical protein
MLARGASCGCALTWTARRWRCAAELYTREDIADESR